MGLSNKQTKLELLNNIYQKLSEQLSFKDVLKTLSPIIKENLQCQTIDFVLIDDNDPLKYNIYSIQKNEEVDGREIEPHGIAKKVIESKKTIAAEDVREVPYYYRCREHTISELCIPVFYKKKVIGCINLEFTKKQTFDKDTITTLEIIGQSIGPTLKNAKLYEDLELSEKKFRQLVEHMNEGLWVGDKKHVTTYVNPKFAQMAGISQEECIGKICWAFYDEESEKRIHENHKLRPLGKSSQYELTMLTPKGNQIPLLCSGAPIPDGTVGIFTDLRLLKEKEKQIQELSKSEKLLAHISDNSIDAIVSLDRNLAVKTWNKGAIRMFGYTKEEATGQNIKFLYPPEKLKQGELEYIVKNALEKGFLKNYESIRLNKNGKEVNVSLSVTKLTDEKDRFMGLSIIYRDISYQKKAEKELQSRFESMQSAYLELGKQRRELDYLLETLNIAIGDEQFPNVENYVVNAAIMLTKANGATLRLFNEKDGYLYLKAANGIQPEWWGKSKIQFKDSIAERAYKLRQPLFVNDIQNNPGYTSPKLAAEHNFVSCLLIPLYVKNKYLGNISLYSSNKNKLHLIDNSFIANFGKQASLALFTNVANNSSNQGSSLSVNLKKLFEP
jgi:PAS domain S-box-containing protein